MDCTAVYGLGCFFRGLPHPPVFFVRVANTRLILDAACKSGKYET